MKNIMNEFLKSITWADNMNLFLLILVSLMPLLNLKRINELRIWRNK